MAFSQWTRSGQNAQFEAILTTSSPIEGSGSLQTHHITGGSTTYGVVGLTSGANISSGKIRTIFNIVTKPDAWAVFAMMQSSILFSSTAYYACFPFGDGSNVFLRKITAANINSTNTVTEGALAVAAHGLTLSNGATKTVELKWQYDSGAGIMFLYVSVGSATDFSDLTQKIAYSDGSPLVTGVSAGVAFSDSTSSSAGNEIKWDKTQIFKVA